MISQLEQALLELGANLGAAGAEPPVNRLSTQDDDLLFFHSMAQRIDQLNIYWKKRPQETTLLASELNRLLGEVAEPRQLEAAICVHDLGMALIPHSIFNKQTELADAEQKIVRGHIERGADLLARIPGWDAASVFIRQHHERHVGD